MVYLMRAFVNVFVLRQFGLLSAVAVTRLRLTIAIYRGAYTAGGMHCQNTFWCLLDPAGP
jgi:hypothetical protein